jgi:CRISPR/Cas system-associated protein Cas10 (large subunit of type III CRISPR-Cas system)
MTQELFDSMNWSEGIDLKEVIRNKLIEEYNLNPGDVDKILESIDFDSLSKGYISALEDREKRIADIAKRLNLETIPEGAFDNFSNTLILQVSEKLTNAA